MSGWSLGFGGSGHDWSACALDPDGAVVVVEEAALTRLKYGLGAPLLESAARRHVEGVVAAGGGTIAHAAACDLVPPSLFAPWRRSIARLSHHEAHALGAFHASPFEDAAVLIADRGGSPAAGTVAERGAARDIETLSAWRANRGKLERLWTQYGRHELTVARPSDYFQVGETADSLGELYAVATEELGFVFGEPGRAVPEDGKTMALAAGGDGRFFGCFSDLVALAPQCVRVDTTGGHLRRRMRKLLDGSPPDETVRRASLAEEVQRLLEDALVRLATDLGEKTGQRNLVLAGGVFLNCVANARVAAEAGFERVFVLPSAGDAGTALGAALHAHLRLSGRPSPRGLNGQLPFLGPTWPDQDVEDAHRKARVSGWVLCSEGGEAPDRCARALDEGGIVAVWEGRSEFGPRALGHRSLLGDPRDAATRERVNLLVKRRERFRPFAPVVLDEAFDAVFEGVSAAKPMYPFMLATCRVRPEYRARIPAVVHLDGTARVQVATATRAPRLHAIVSRFWERTGVPVLLNTSFNITGEPMVERPTEAVDTATRMGLEWLLLNGHLLRRETK